MSIVSAHTLHPQDQASSCLEQDCGLKVTGGGPDVVPSLGSKATKCFQNSRGTCVSSDSSGVLMSPDEVAAIES